MEPFDTVAPVYDQQFSFAATGKLQRQMVWNYLLSEPYFGSPRDILDINCGTGEDALWLAAHGHTVVATDSSEAMLTEARKKDRSEWRSPPVFLKHDLKEKEWNWLSDSYDAVCSNFSGLNCFGPEDMQSIAANLLRITKPQGRLILVLFGKYCVSEMIYFAARGKFASAGRRMSGRPVTANVEGQPVEVWYHSARQMQSWLKGFRLKRKFAIGLFQPPSYMEEKFSRRPGLVRLSGALEKMAGHSSLFTPFGDHMLLDFEKV